MRKWLLGLTPILLISGCAIGTDSTKIAISSHINKYNGKLDTNYSHITIEGESDTINIRFTNRANCQSFRDAINKTIDSIEKELPDESVGAKRS